MEAPPHKSAPIGFPTKRPPTNEESASILEQLITEATATQLANAIRDLSSVISAVSLQIRTSTILMTRILHQLEARVDKPY